jgi:hypothetical protein
MQIGESFTYVSKIFFNVSFSESFHFDFVEESASICILKYHVGDFPIGINVDIDKLDDFGMGETIVHQNFIFSNFIDLDARIITTLTATIVTVCRSFASLT